MKKLFKGILILIFVFTIILGLVYLGLGYYYRDSFAYGTRINGIYCTGHTPEEVNKLLNEKYEYSGLDIVTENGEEVLYIKPQDIDFTYNFDQALAYFLETQNSWEWPINLISKNSRTLNPIVNFNTDMLDTILNSSEYFTYSTPPEVSYDCIDGVYVLTDTMMHRPDIDALRDSVYDCIYDSIESFVIDDSYFYDIDYSPEQIATLQEYSAIKTMMGARITYVLGDDREIIDESVLNTFLLRDEHGNLVPVDTADDQTDDEGENKKKAITDIEEDPSETDETEITDAYKWDRDAIDAWVDALAEKYDTVGATRKFTTHDGDTIEITGGIYGNKLDVKAEKEYLTDAVMKRKTEEHEPEYTQTALVQGLDDIGDTYIEVNMTGQMLYYYENGETVIETPVVTGNMARRMNTPAGTNYVYFKQRNRTLIGPNYQTFVHYWMAVNGHIGIHDATWRSEFGNDIYLRDGSHGCINTPMEAVSTLYEKVEIGTPVIMYYLD